MQTRLRRTALAVGLGSLALALAGTASAHGETVETPPIPFFALVVGAAVAVAGTALALAVGPDPPTGRVRLGSVHGRTVGRATLAIRLVVALALAAAVASGLTDRGAVTFAEVLVWPVLFKGSLVVAALVGSPWRVVSPWEMAYDALAALEGEDVAVWSYPEWLGRWPAVAGLVVVVGVVENLTVVPNSGRLTVAFLAAYALVALLGALAFGREAFERADAFTVLYDLAGRVAPVATERDGERVVVSLRPPWVESARPLADAGTAAFVVVAVATVTFDGAVETTAAARLLGALAEPAGAYAGVVLYVGFLAAFIGAAVLARRAVTRAAASASSSRLAQADGGRGVRSEDTAPAGRVGRHLAATLLPIAVAYDVAHNYPYVLVNATRALERTLGAVGVPAAFDPGSALAPAAVWTTQVALVVVGHLVAVVAAHLATDRVFADAKRARRGHAPLAALMVAYTVASLYVLAAP
ncbi:hypothetical protein G9C85_05365 [Halorubellus sp. JP-L1]|uniref:hypothetical protein n=1 Tax=Halorubellus sp. JP-L1 TaxID=2715753 RepID=UPI00140AA2C8|nr:hypothetical protein [Halorubellus sp. JP-L1]NHN41065.1 hypothetical protein [Halorubellus sp. JP-L1]